MGVLWVKGGLVDHDEDLKNKESGTDKNESKNFTSLEGDPESLFNINVAKVGGLDVSHGGNSHADVSAKHGGKGSNNEGGGGVWETWVSFNPWHIDSAEHNGGEHNDEDTKGGIFFFEESNSSLKIEKNC